MVLEEARSDQPFSGRVLCGAVESFAGAFFGRAGQRAVQHRSSGEVDRLVVVAQAAGGLAVVDEPRSRSERVAVVSEPCQDLAGVREDHFQSLQGAHGSVERPSQPARKLLRRARLVDACEQRLDGAVIRGPVPGKVVDRAAPRPAGQIIASVAQRAVSAVVGTRARPAGPMIAWSVPQRAISAAAVS